MILLYNILTPLKQHAKDVRDNLTNNLLIIYAELIFIMWFKDVHVCIKSENHNQKMQYFACNKL